MDENLRNLLLKLENLDSNQSTCFYYFKFEIPSLQPNFKASMQGRN